MKNIIIIIITLFFLPVFLFPVKAQQKEQHYPWQLGIGAGYTNYYGDLSNYRIDKWGDIGKIYHFGSFNQYYIPQPSFSVLLQKKINPTIGFLLQFNQLGFAMSDRYRNTNGTIDMSGVNFARSLNFKTTLRDAGFALTFSAANGHAIKENSFFYPSFYLGGGVAVFNVLGDLYDGDGNPYNYRQPGQINDGNFETNLRDIKTETLNRYSNVAPYLDLGLSLNFRISSLFTLSLQSDIKYSGTDFLDDVNGQYKTTYPSTAAAFAAHPGYNVIDPVTRQRGDMNSINDVYINNRVVLHIHLSKRTAASTFKAPAIYSLATATDIYTPSVIKAAKQTLPRIDTVSVRMKDTLSPLKDTVPLRIHDTAYQHRVENKLDSIQQQLTAIKTVIRNQAFDKAYQYLRFKQDSVKLLKKAIQSKKNLSREDNLTIRIYDLQADSLRTEMQQLQRRAEAGMGAGDSTWMQPAAYNFNFMKPVAVVQQTMANSVLTDSVYAITGSLTDEQVASLNREMTLFTNDKRYGKDSIYRKTIDSLNGKLKDYEAEKQRQATMQQLTDSLQFLQHQLKVYTPKDSSLHKSSIYKADTVLSPVPVDTAISSNAHPVAAGQMEADSTAAKLLLLSQNRLRQNNDSIAVLKSAVQQSRDSAAYYRQLAFAANGPVKTTAEKPAKWYQRILPGKGKNEKNTGNAETLRTEEREKYYDGQLAQLHERLNALQQRNISLSNEYDQNRRRRDNRLSIPAPVPVIIPVAANNGNNAGDLRDLRNEINGLRNQLIAQQVLAAAGGREPVQATLAKTDSVHTPLARDTVYVKTPVVDSLQHIAVNPQVMAMQQQILLLQTEMAKLKTAPVKSAAVVASKEKLEDVTVYFGLNASSLSSEQINKLAVYNSAKKAGATRTFVLTGYTDGAGNAASNNVLAKKRMNYTKQLLVTRFDIPAAQIIMNDPVIHAAPGSKENALQRKVFIEARQ